MSTQSKRSFLRSIFCLGDKEIVSKSPQAPSTLVLPAPGRLNVEATPDLPRTTTGPEVTGSPHPPEFLRSHTDICPVPSTSRAPSHSSYSAPNPVPSELRLTSTPQLLSPSPPQISQRFFDNAQGFNLNNFEYHNHSHDPTIAAGWKLLLENTAGNALLTSGARHDPPRCDEDTRIEVINEILGWIQDRTAPHRLLCMTGAAGAGKSALQQSVAESCAKPGIVASCFFFNSTDGTRNNATMVVPTIAYQLGQRHPILRRSITAAVEDDPLIFIQNLRVQIERLPPSDFASFPYAIFIDGLDECMQEREQRELLSAIQACLLDDRTPFRIFIASRPELPIFEALRPGGHLCRDAYHLRLSDDYDATEDIRRTLHRRLSELGERRGLSPNWFSDAEIEIIVAAASGQYVYATTVIRYLSDPRGSPLDRLRTILSWVSGKQKGKGALASLDLLYASILARAKEAYEAADIDQTDFTLILQGYLFIGDSILPGMRQFDRLLDLEEGTHELIICDLRSLMTVKDENDSAGNNMSGALTFYHKTFKDFLGSKDRCGDMYIGGKTIQEFVSVRGLRMLNKWDEPTLLTALNDSNSKDAISLSILRGAIDDTLDALDASPPPDEMVDSFILFAKNSGLEPSHSRLVVVDSSGGKTRLDSDWRSLSDRLLPYIEVGGCKVAKLMIKDSLRTTHSSQKSDIELGLKTSSSAETKTFDFNTASSPFSCSFVLLFFRDDLLLL
ncbi:hypothetical protein DFP72DRAFT_842653 [Ephemerocybe angulata]|uniref:Nephrocystin 3-like N-terminal domain-containing protein n=1 Tax=Ephemerocybe angulata TaxID=980116 RepID=A0A8H6IAA2_9AGAR|nr:hypothetical protein DFP72DRAFT_842653 [Tulosesus angulatus]